MLKFLNGSWSGDAMATSHMHTNNKVRIEISAYHVITIFSVNYLTVYK